MMTTPPNSPTPKKFGLGRALQRKEDQTLISGLGQFTDDNCQQGCLRGFVVRSPYAHAEFNIDDVTAALAAPGVKLVLTGKDVEHLKPISCVTLFEQPDGTPIVDRPIPILCKDRVRHVGDAVAFVVAETVDQAKDAAELIEIDYTMRDAAVHTATARNPGTAQVYEDAKNNIAFNNFFGDQAKTDAAFANAATVSEVTLINNRLVCNYMEPRSVVAHWNDDQYRFDVDVCSQGVHSIQSALCKTFGLSPENIHVRTGDVGGGFGTKTFTYREYPLAMEAAKRLKQSVKWTSDRNEHFLADAHGRDNIVTAKMAMDEQGKFLAMDVDLVACMGAYLNMFGPYIPTLGAIMTTGLYDIDTMAVRIQGVFTHTVPVDAYRGAGRPEAAYLVERLVDKCAMDLDMTPDEIRRKNFIKPEQLPYTTQGGRTYDTGEFSEHLKLCMQRANWDSFEERNQKAMEMGKIRGIGLSTYVEACAFAGSEPAYVELMKDGTVELKIGTQSNGQGHATAYAQLAAEQMGLDYSQVRVRQGDTDELAKGGGTGGSRSIPLGGVSAFRAGENLAEKIKAMAADHLEASAGDIELVDGMAVIAGTDRQVSFAELANHCDDPERLKAEGNFKQDEATYPNGTHICEVEIDPQTGTTDIVAYTIMDDFGATVNPLLLAGQVHGGVVQAIGQCLQEHTVYDDDGQLITASLMDYQLPRAEDIPYFDFETRNVPSTTNALGIKGAGEAGTIGGGPAVMNAVVNALYRYKGLTHIDMPATPAKIWATLQG